MANEDEAPVEARNRRQVGTKIDDRRGWIWLLALVELVAMFMVATGLSGNYRAFLASSGAELLVALAATAAGGVIGLLFGLPHRHGEDRAASALAELARWLPLLVIGAALVEAGEIVHWIGTLGVRAGAAFGFAGGPGSLVGSAIVVFNLLFGFLAFFIYVRPDGRAESAPAAEGGTGAAVRAATTASAIMNALHRPPPGGYERAIREARAFLRDPANERNGTIWMYLARAYGQKHAALQASAPSVELRRLAQNALEAVRRARREEPDLKDAMRALWDPNDESHIEGENDLQSFYDDPRLRDLFAQELI